MEIDTGVKLLGHKIHTHKHIYYSKILSYNLRVTLSGKCTCVYFKK